MTKPSYAHMKRGDELRRTIETNDDTKATGDAPVKISRIAVTDGLVQGPILRVSLGGGCYLLECHCSDEPFILISDGKTMLTATLDRETIERITQHEVVEVTGVTA